MSFQRFPLNVVGSSNPSRASSQSSARTLNLYPDVSQTGETGRSLLPWPGSKAFSSAPTLIQDRGMHVHSKTGVLYKVTDIRLYSVSSAGVQTDLGGIAGSGRVVMADDGTNLLIATNLNGYIYNGATLSVITDADYQPGGSVAVVNDQAVWEGNGPRIIISDVEDPGTINALNFAEANVAGDDVERIYVFRQNVFVLGSETVEVWYNTGIGNPPFSRVNNATSSDGIISKHAICETENYLYWINKNKKLVRTQAYQPQAVSDLQVQNTLEGYSMSDAVLQQITFNGQNFILLLFPSDDASWCYSETTGAWFELAYSADETRYIGSSYVYAYGKHLIASRLSGDIYELDFDTFTDNGVEVIRERVMEPFSAARSGAVDTRMLMSKLELFVQKGVGLISGQGEEPRVMFSVSYDQGKSFTNEDWISIGRMGEGDTKVEWYNMGSAYSFTVRIRFSDPCFLGINAAAIWLRPGGW